MFSQSTCIEQLVVWSEGYRADIYGISGLHQSDSCLPSQRTGSTWCLVILHFLTYLSCTWEVSLFFFFLCLSTKYNHFYSMTSCLSICEVNFLQLKAVTIIVPQIYPRPLVLAGKEGVATSKDTSRLVVRVPANLLLWSILFGPASWFYPIQFVLLQAWVWWMIARKKTLHRSDIQIVTNTHIYSLQHWMLRLSSLRLGSIKISLLKRINHNGQKLIVWWSMLC